MKPTIPEVVARFARYYEAHPAWGVMHIVLDDENVEDGYVDHCIGFANEENDREGFELATILRTMSETQRRKLPRAVKEWIARQ